jgi:Na+/melibiose symporter-like transporter
MIDLLALALVAAGLALIIGAREVAKKIGFAVLAVIVGLFAVRCLLCQLAATSASADQSSFGLGWFWLVAVSILVAVGAFAWKTRGLRERRLEELRRRGMHPRRLAPPPAPDARAEDDGMFS